MRMSVLKSKELTFLKRVLNRIMPKNSGGKLTGWRNLDESPVSEGCQLGMGSEFYLKWKKMRSAGKPWVQLGFITVDSQTHSLPMQQTAENPLDRVSLRTCLTQVLAGSLSRVGYPYLRRCRREETQAYRPPISL